MALDAEDRPDNQNDQAQPDIGSEAAASSSEPREQGSNEDSKENQQTKGESELTATSQQAQPVDEGRKSDQEGAKSEEKSSRMNAAKAFYRAMYAGEDVIPDDFGVGGPRTPSSTEDRSRGTCGNCQSLSQQLSESETKASEIDGLYKRMAADFDNFRKRTEREREELLGLGMQRAVEAILPALDDLDRAQTTFTPESDARNMVDTLKLIYNRFSKCLEQMGVKPMDVIGQPFDPKFHEPVQQIVTKDLPEGSVMHDLRRGYLMRDKVVRPALVNVATHPSDSEPVEPAAEQPEAEQAETERTVSAGSEAPAIRVPITPEEELATATAEIPTLGNAGELTLRQGGELHRTDEEASTEDEDEEELEPPPLPRRITREGTTHKRAHKNDDVEDKAKEKPENPGELAEFIVAESQGSDE